MPSKLKVGVICGGQSSEHEISLLSAKFVFHSLDRAKFQPYLIGIDKKGRWRLYEDGQKWLWHETDPAKIKLAPGYQPVVLLPSGQGQVLFLDQPNKNLKLDVIFPVLHGPMGEDGTIQGLFELAGVAYVGSGVLGSAVAMDKAVTKRLWRQAGLPILDWLEITQDNTVSFADAKAKLELPMFVKPANAGSSVGISKVKNAKDYEQALELAFKHDQKVLVEQGLDQPREIEVAILENQDGKLTASTPGEIRPKHEFYSYEAKYLDEDGAELIIPAPLSQSQIKKTKALAKQAFKIIGASGLARIDFFMIHNDESYLSEINTMPGFTAISMYPKLMEFDGVGGQELVKRLIEQAIEKKSKISSLIS